MSIGGYDNTVVVWKLVGSKPETAPESVPNEERNNTSVEERKSDLQKSPGPGEKTVDFKIR